MRPLTGAAALLCAALWPGVAGTAEVTNNLERFDLQSYLQSGDRSISIRAESAHLGEGSVLHIVQPRITDARHGMELRARAGRYRLEDGSLELSGDVIATIEW